jgi:hypothetical protein
MLTFPTLAEQALARVRESKVTLSIATVARRMGADVERSFEGETTYTFDDDTSVVTKGRGRAHVAEALLP